MFLRILLALVGVLLVSSTASANQQAWLITGQVASIYNDTLYSSPFTVGDVFTHRFTIDDGAPRTGGNLNSSVFDALSSARFEIASLGYTIDWNNGTGIETVNFSSGDDYWNLFGTGLTSSIPTLGPGTYGPTDFRGLNLAFNVPDNTFLADPPPLIQPNPTWTLNNYSFSYSSSGGGRRESLAVSLQINSFQAIPEPGTYALGLLALAGLWGLRRARERAA